MGLFTGLSYVSDSNLILVKAGNNLKMSNGDFDEFINVVTHHHDGKTMFGCMTRQIEHILIEMTKTRIVSDQNIIKLFNVMSTWKNVMTGIYILDYRWIDNVINSGVIIKSNERKLLIKIKYPKIEECYKHIKEDMSDDEVITLLEYYPKLLMNNKQLIKKINLTDENIQLFFKNTIDLSIMKKIDFLKYCKYEIDFNKNLLDFGRDVTFSEYETAEKIDELKIILKNYKFTDPITICKNDGSLNDELICFLNSIQKKLNSHDLFLTIAKIKLSKENFDQNFVAIHETDIKYMKKIMVHFSDILSEELITSLLYSLHEMYENVCSYKMLCVLTSIQKNETFTRVEHVDSALLLELYKTLWKSSLNLKIKTVSDAYIREIMRLSIDFKKDMSNFFVKIGQQNYAIDYNFIDPQIGFKYACIYLDYDMITHYLNQKYIPIIDHVMYILLGSAGQTIEYNKRAIQNKIFSAFKGYGMKITEEIFDILNFSYSFSTWDFSKEVHDDIKTKFKSKDSTIKHLANIQKALIYSNTECNYLQSKKPGYNLSECYVSYICTHEKLSVILQCIHDDSSQDLCSMCNCTDKSVNCIEMSILNPNAEVFEYIYDTYMEPFGIKPNVILISMIFDYFRRYLMINRFYSSSKKCIITNDEISDPVSVKTDTNESIIANDKISKPVSVKKSIKPRKIRAKK
jgi:hypothetical protein